MLLSAAFPFPIAPAKLTLAVVTASVDCVAPVLMIVPPASGIRLPFVGVVVLEQAAVTDASGNAVDLEELRPPQAEDAQADDAQADDEA